VSVATFTYRASQAVLAPGAHRAIDRCVRDWAAALTGDGPVLDVGCGPRSWVAAHAATTMGLDVDRAALAALPVPAVTADAAYLPVADGVCAGAAAVGLLHHLPDAAATTAVRELQRVVAPGGSVLVFDGITPTGRRPVAAAIRRRDRGRHLRSGDALRALLAATGDWSVTSMRYAATGLEGVAATWRRP
jgi:SAM-dependent methyltransferase